MAGFPWFHPSMDVDTHYIFFRDGHVAFFCCNIPPCPNSRSLKIPSDIKLVRGAKRLGTAVLTNTNGHLFLHKVAFLFRFLATGHKHGQPRARSQAFLAQASTGVSVPSLGGQTWFLLTNKRHFSGLGWFGGGGEALSFRS